MNYFAHGMQYVDRPYFLAGTAFPDWLSVADRKVRMRARRVEPVADDSRSVLAEVAAGILQHLADDQHFHGTRAFIETSGEMTRQFRRVLGSEDGFRPGFLGHIATELLLDAVLIARDPSLLDRYYGAVDSVDPLEVQRAVNRMGKSETTRLAVFIPLFRNEEFLRDYQEPSRLLYRLNQVMRRIKLKPLPDEIEEVLQDGRKIVELAADRLLPERTQLDVAGERRA